MKLYRFLRLTNRKIYKYSINIIRGLTFKNFGKKAMIYKPLLLNGREYINIGNNVFILNNARIEALKVAKNIPEIVIGDNTIIQQDVHITSGGKLIIGSNCTFAPRVMVTNIDHSYEIIGQHILTQPDTVSETVIGDNCFIGINSAVFPGVHLGKNVIVGANSVVMNDVPDYCVVVGAPAKIVKRYSFESNTWEKE